MIEVKNLRKKFDTQIVLDGISFTVDKSQTLAVVGPSGTGKSVLLKIITGLLEADWGEVIVGGESLAAASTSRDKRRIYRRMGVLFQGAALFDSLTLLDNVAFPLRDRREISEKEIIKRSLRLLDEVGLRGRELAYPGEVSIGMRKRVGIARALVTNPDVLLFDEPNTGLDPTTGQEIYELMIEIQKHAGFTGIVVSHEIPEVFQVCNQVVMLYRGEIQERGTPEDFLKSRNPVVRQFVRGDVEGPIEMS